MKLTKLVAVVRNLRVLFFFVLGGLFLPIVTASGVTHSIDVGGWWPLNKRSIESSISITASIDSRTLSIKNTSPNCDITITIINESGEIVYEQEVPAVDTANICIPMNGLPAGEYKLELTKPSGNYLRGNFTLY